MRGGRGVGPDGPGLSLSLSLSLSAAGARWNVTGHRSTEISPSRIGISSGIPPIPYRCPSSSGHRSLLKRSTASGRIHLFHSVKQAMYKRTRPFSPPLPEEIVRRQPPPPSSGWGIFSELLHTKWLSEDWPVTIDATLALCIHSAPRRHSTTALKNRIGGTGPPEIYRAGSYPAITLTKVDRGRVARLFN